METETTASTSSRPTPPTPALRDASGDPPLLPGKGRKGHNFIQGEDEDPAVPPVVPEGMGSAVRPAPSRAVTVAFILWLVAS